MLLLHRLEEIADKRNLKSLVFTAPDNITYAIGIDVVGDFVGILHYSKESGWTLYVPVLEYYRFRENLPQTIDVVGVSKTQRPPDAKVVEKDWKTIIAEIAESLPAGADISHTSPLTRILLEVKDRFADISADIWEVRSVKTDSEIEHIKKAVETTARAIETVASFVDEGVSETYLAGLFEYRSRLMGVEKFAFEPIVAFKPGNSYPHYLPSSRRAGRGELILIDVGVKSAGRCSDLTRMIVLHRVSEREARVLEAVEEALDASIDFVSPGVKAGEVHEVAAKTLEKHGLRDRFIHGLGHGIGVLVHEPPYLRPGSDTLLRPGMVFTLEPGVYFRGEFGVRIEEDVVITKRGARVLSRRLERVIYI